MALFLQHKTDDIQWAVWKMEESLDALLALLPDARRVFCEQDLNRFVSERRKMEWLSVRVLLYAMLQEDRLFSRRKTVSDGSFFFHQYFSYERLCSCDACFFHSGRH